MKPMTWKEFKEFVESRLEEQGLNEDSEIGVFDFSYPEDNSDLILFEQDKRIWIW
jgi:hypothetical protein